MDIWRYYDVIHTLHTFMNPVSEEAVEELEAVLDPKAGMRVLDIACGKGEMLVRLAERYDCPGVGVDASPFCIERARANRDERVPGAEIQFLETKGEDYGAEEPFDVAMCIGASWIWNGFRGTLGALKRFVRPGGLVVSGEPYWRAEPPPEWLEAEELKEEDLLTLQGCFLAAREAGLTPVWMRGSSQQEWDRYEMLQTASLDRFEREDPGDPDLPEIRERLWKSKDAYLGWGREGLGYALWVFRRP